MSLIPLEKASPTLQGLFDRVEGVRINEGSTNPLAALYALCKRSPEKHRIAIYTPPVGAPYWCFLTEREVVLAKQISPTQWLPLPEAKEGGETRKPISNLRQFGFVIATRRTQARDRNGEKVSHYRLIGSVKINPTLEELEGIPSLVAVFPDVDEAERMTRDRINRDASKRRRNAKKTARAIRLRRKNNPVLGSHQDRVSKRKTKQ